MNKFLLVAMGGAIGSASRFGLGIVVVNFLNFPLATFIANVLGCFLIGIIDANIQNPSIKFLLIPGFLGGFTTFSGFSNDYFKLIEQGNILLAIGYVILTVLFCLLAVSAGNILAKILL